MLIHQSLLHQNFIVILRIAWKIYTVFFVRNGGEFISGITK